MGLITLLLVMAFTALYLSKALAGKPEPLAKVASLMSEHIQEIAFWGSVYAAAAAVLTLVMHYGVTGMMIRFSSNVLILVMALPFIIDRLVTKYQAKVNVVILEEAKNLVAWISKNEKILGYVGGAFSLALFFTVFK